MKLSNFLTATFFFASGLAASLSHPVEIRAPVEGEVVETGTTEEGEPYTITHGTRVLTADEIAQWNNETLSLEDTSSSDDSLEKRWGGGAGPSCEQTNLGRYCFCGGAISNRGDCYWGSQDHCNNVANDRGKSGVYGHTESYTVKWLPTVKIEYRIKNFCPNTYKLTFSDCGANFLDLIDWCQWTWMTQKGGNWRITHCYDFSFDVQQR